MRILWYIFIPSVYLLIAAFVQRMAKKAQQDDQMTSEQIDGEDTQ
jgi:hypothetical protein